MKIITQKVAIFNDIERSQIPLVNIKNVQHDIYKLILTLRHFGVTAEPFNFIIFYGDEEVCTDDYVRLLRKLKQLGK